MDITYRKAALADLPLLTETRAEVLLAANGLPPETDMEAVGRETRRYYRHALPDGSHIAYLAFDGDRLAGTGGASFFQVLPTYHNPSGKKAYLMNIYTRPGYRRQGIACKILDLLVRDARDRGVTAISLEATAMGRPLYERYGFVRMNDEMELPE